jgi:hypothetical protein
VESRARSATSRVRAIGTSPVAVGAGNRPPAGSTQGDQIRAPSGLPAKARPPFTARVPGRGTRRTIPER